MMVERSGNSGKTGSQDVTTEPTRSISTQPLHGITKQGFGTMPGELLERQNWQKGSSPIMAQQVGQNTSRHQPAVVFDGQTYHMVFSANDNSNRILYITSSDGLNWTNGPNTNETSGAAPALVLYQQPALSGGFTKNYIVLVFVANDSSHRVLYATLNLTDPVGERAWIDRGQVGGESAQAVFALTTGVGLGLQINVYFESNDSSNRLLETQFIPE